MQVRIVSTSAEMQAEGLLLCNEDSMHPTNSELSAMTLPDLMTFVRSQCKRLRTQGKSLELYDPESFAVVEEVLREMADENPIRFPHWFVDAIMDWMVGDSELDLDDIHEWWAIMSMKHGVMPLGTNW